jgi:hypothetical protein
VSDPTYHVGEFLNSIGILALFIFLVAWLVGLSDVYGWLLTHPKITTLGIIALVIVVTTAEED